MTAMSVKRISVALTTVVAILATYLIYIRYPHSTVQFGGIASNRQHEYLDDTLNSTLGFQKIFAINLPSRTDLRDAVVLAARLTNLDIEIVDGVDGTTIHDDALPPGNDKEGLKSGHLGNWRAHVNVAQLMVQRNIQSALVIENDADWDIRIKQQMRQFAQSSRLLLQPLLNTNDSFLDPSIPRTQEGSSSDTITIDSADEDAKLKIQLPTTSPYGDLNRWDMLWLGHCGCRFPLLSDGNAPLGRVAIYDDATVPEKSHIDVDYGDTSLKTEYPEHTRVIARARVNTCTLGYALSQNGAQKTLHNVGITDITGPTDMMFRTMCDNGNPDPTADPTATCLTVRPQLFQHHRPKGPRAKESNIDHHGDVWNPHAYSLNIRWSTRLNFARLIAGRTDYIDLYQDGVPGSSWAEDD